MRELEQQPGFRKRSLADERARAVYASDALRNSSARYHASPSASLHGGELLATHVVELAARLQRARIEPGRLDVRVNAGGALGGERWRTARPNGIRPPRSSAAKASPLPLQGNRAPPRGARRPRRGACAAACTAVPRRPRRAAANGGIADSRRAPRRRDRAAGPTSPGPAARASPSSASQASIRGWNVSPNTAARRTRARSSGARPSIRAIAAASAESGRSAMPPDSIAVRNRSRRNCGFPPERLATTSRTCIGQRMLLGRQLRHPQRILPAQAA